MHVNQNFNRQRYRIDPHNLRFTLSVKLEIAKNVIFHEFNEMNVERPEKYGGNVSYSNYNELHTDFAENKLHPGDLKQTVGNYLVKVISPIREKLNLSEEISEAIKKSF